MKERVVGPVRPTRTTPGSTTSSGPARGDLCIIPAWAAASDAARSDRRSMDQVNDLTAEVLSSPGSPLPAAVRADLENEVSALHVSPVVPRRQAVDGESERQAATVADHTMGHRVAPEYPFGHHFDDVRIHTDSIAAASAAILSARAYTLGVHIVFGPGQYAPSTWDGRRVLAHELAHVVQQRDLPMSERLVQRTTFGDSVHLDSLPDDPPRARLLAPYRDEAVAQELYGDPAAPVQYSPGVGLVVLIDMQRLLPRWRSLFSGTAAAKRNTWPYPGFSANAIQSYVDERVVALAINLVTGRGVVQFDDNSSVEVPLSWFDPRDLDILPLVPAVSSQHEAETAVASIADIASARGMRAVAFYHSGAMIWPTLLNPQTAPRMFSVYPRALDAALADVRATERTFVDLLFWYIGARTIPGLGMGGGGQAGRLIIESGRTLTAEESAIVGRLLNEGRTVRVLAESTKQGVRTADFIVDGVRTELKTISSLTSKDLSGALGRRILEGAGQAPNIIADVRGQAGLTRELAERAIRRAFGADTLSRIQQIRVIGDGFDVVVPRI